MGRKRGRARKETRSQAQLSQQHRSQTPSLQNFNILKWRCAWAPVYVSTEQHLHGVNYNRGSAIGIIWRLMKNDRDRSTLNTGNSLRVHGCRSSIPGKIWMPTNQIRAITARAHASRELRARAPQASRGI